MTSENSIQAKILSHVSHAKRLLIATGVLTAATFFMGFKAAQQDDPAKQLALMGTGMAMGLTAAGTRRLSTRATYFIDIDHSNPQQAEEIQKLWRDQNLRPSVSLFMTPFFAGGGGFTLEIGAKRLSHPAELVGAGIAATALLTSADNISDYRRLMRIQKLSSELRPSSPAFPLTAG